MKKFEKMLIEELDGVTPDLKSEIKAKAGITAAKTESGKNRTRLRRIFAPVAAALAVLIAVITPVFALNPAGGKINGYSLVMSVNPSVQIDYGTDNKVISARGLNKDGVMLLYRNDIVGQDVKTVTKTLFTRMNALGYLGDGGNVNITVKDDKGAFSEEQFRIISDDVCAFLKTAGSGKTVLRMTEEDFEKLEDDIEEREREYLLAFEEEIKSLLSENLSAAETLADGIKAAFAAAYPDIDVSDDRALEDAAEDDETPLSDGALIAEIREYGELYDDDIAEDYDFAEGAFKMCDLFEIYEDLCDALREIRVAEQDVINGRIPDDLDDMIEIIVKRRVSV